jgi:hypothetical protein
MIPNEVTAQLFRGRLGGQKHCQPVCCTPTYNQMSYQQYNGSYYGSNYGSASYVSHQPSNCCGSMSAYGTYTSGMNQSGSQYPHPQESFDSQGNRIDMGNQWNNQQRFDAQGNPIDMGTQVNGQQRFDAQGNRIDAQGNRIDVDGRLDGQQRFDAQGNRINADGQLDGQQRLDTQGNPIDSNVPRNQGGTQIDPTSSRTGVQGSTGVGGVETPISRDR